MAELGKKLDEMTRPDPDATDDTPDGARFTDAGNARRFVELHGDAVRYVASWGEWLTWDGRRWVLDPGGVRTVEMAKDVGRHLWSMVPNVARKAAIVAWATRSESLPGVKAMVALAAGHPRVLVEHEQLDADPWRLNVQNGVIDLRTGLLEQHDPDLLMTRYAPTIYDENATSPNWQEFLERVLPDAEVRSFMRRLIGYALTGVVSEHVLALLIGEGANGKSTLERALRVALGDYAVTAPRDLLIVQRHEPHPTSVTTLHRARLAFASEIEAGARLAEAKVKELTGGDRLTARRMRENFWSFDPTHQLLLAANHRPTVSGGDVGIWRRLKVIAFPVVIPVEERDPHLGDRLAKEAPGILAWAVEGCLEWQRIGLAPPEAVELASEAYRAEQDIVGQFLEAVGLELRHDLVIAAGELRRQYTEWCSESGIDPLDPRPFASYLRARGCHDSTRRRERVWHGVGHRALELT